MDESEGSAKSPTLWTNASVVAFAGGDDPQRRAVSLARSIMIAAADEGVVGPPFDPLVLARLMGLRIEPRADVSDARVVVDEGGGQQSSGPEVSPLAHLVSASAALRLEYNPTRPRGRMRYSVAHELGHALFPDVAEAPRHRTGSGAVPQEDDSWQLEMLCNIVAAEILMPADAVAGLADIDHDIDYLMDQRRRFDVSTEALLRRIATSTRKPLCMVALLRQPDRPGSPLKVEYVTRSHSFAGDLERGTRFPEHPELAFLGAVGQTARCNIDIAGTEYHLEAVGSPAYAGRSMPRVLGLLAPVDSGRALPDNLHYESGDISTAYAGDSPILIAHVTNDSARTWGGKGVASALARRYPSARGAYHGWATQRGALEAGEVHIAPTAENPLVHIASIVAQRGFGPGSPPRLMYRALARGLQAVGEEAKRLDAAVHLPRIGTGQAGGRWDLVETEIDEALVSRGISVGVFTLPARRGEQ